MAPFVPNKLYQGKEIFSIDVKLDIGFPFFVESGSGKTMLIADQLADAIVKIIDKDGNEIFSERYEHHEEIGGVGWHDGAYYVLLYDRADFAITILKYSEDGRLIGKTEPIKPIPVLLGEYGYGIVLRDAVIERIDYYARLTTARGKPEFVVSSSVLDYPYPDTKLLFIATPDFRNGKVNVEMLHNYIEDSEELSILERIFAYRDNVYVLSIVDSKKHQILIDKINIFDKHLERHQIDLSEINPEFRKSVPIYSYYMPYIHNDKPFVAIVAYNKYGVKEKMIRIFTYVISLDDKPSIVKHNMKIIKRKESILLYPIVFTDTNDVAASARISEIRSNEIILELEGTDNILLHLVFKKENVIKSGNGEIELLSFDIDPSKIALVYSFNENKGTIAFDSRLVGSVSYKQVFY